MDRRLGPYPLEDVYSVGRVAEVGGACLPASVAIIAQLLAFGKRHCKIRAISRASYPQPLPVVCILTSDAHILRYDDSITDPVNLPGCSLAWNCRQSCNPGWSPVPSRRSLLTSARQICGAAQLADEFPRRPLRPAQRLLVSPPPQ